MIKILSSVPGAFSEFYLEAKAFLDFMKEVHNNA